MNRRCPQALVEGHDDGEQQPEADKAGGPDGEQVQHPTAVRNAPHEAADEGAAEHGHAADERLERTFGGEVAEEDTVDVVGERPGPGPGVTRCPGHERPPVEADQGGRGGQLPTPGQAQHQERDEVGQRNVLQHPRAGKCLVAERSQRDPQDQQHRSPVQHVPGILAPARQCHRYADGKEEQREEEIGEGEAVPVGVMELGRQLRRRPGVHHHQHHHDGQPPGGVERMDACRWRRCCRPFRRRGGPARRVVGRGLDHDGAGAGGLAQRRHVVTGASSRTDRSSTTGLPP